MSTSVAASAVETTYGFRSRGWLLGIAGLILLVGLWTHWSQESYRMDVEELIKENKISPDCASRRVANRKIGGNGAIIGGVFLFLYSLM